MALLIFLFICGVILAVSRAASPTFNAKFEKSVVELIQSLGVVLTWTMWIGVVYFGLAWLGVVPWPNLDWD